MDESHEKRRDKSEGSQIAEPSGTRRARRPRVAAVAIHAVCFLPPLALASLPSGIVHPRRRRRALAGARATRGAPLNPRRRRPDRAAFCWTAEFRASESATADPVRRGPRCAHWAAARASTFAARGALALAEAAAGRRARSSRCSSALGCVRVTSAVLTAAGSVWPGSRGVRSLAPGTPGRLA